MTIHAPDGTIIGPYVLVQRLHEGQGGIASAAGSAGVRPPIGPLFAWSDTVRNDHGSGTITYFDPDQTNLYFSAQAHRATTTATD